MSETTEAERLSERIRALDETVLPKLERVDKDLTDVLPVLEKHGHALADRDLKTARSLIRNVGQYLRWTRSNLMNQLLDVQRKEEAKDEPEA